MSEINMAKKEEIAEILISDNKLLGLFSINNGNAIFTRENDMTIDGNRVFVYMMAIIPLTHDLFKGRAIRAIRPKGYEEFLKFEIEIYEEN